MTEFVQPARKRIKVDSVSLPVASGSAGNVPLVILSDSPEVPKTVSDRTQATEKKPRKVALITLAGSPQLSGRPVDTKDEATTPKCPSTQKPPPKRVQLTTISTAGGALEIFPGKLLTKSEVIPRRMTLTPVTKATSPRRITLTTLSTPPKSSSSVKTVSNSPSSQILQSAVAHTPDKGNLANFGNVTPTNGTKTPHRVSFTTLSPLPVIPKSSSNTLMERSQNTPKMEDNPIQLKDRAMH